ncbi:phosphoribosyltransferase domain protein [Mycobacterium kansasii 662]|uniref:Phosphoribosyltransferase domain protein n=2 Tax=Mycobacterium kansasii TaxID=1768 RepID=A0A1V3WPM3_MYCKA|nr:phosphoribosyltransferase domain protein [Mycobacterium kansasii 824]EUA15734.1 phosphoribosyltransferase domain protein [Mycobacterium kansasii 662]KEP44203.1 hypothetical protein MKSMC1_05640 [Mycobacterium kansasii]OOK68913.1 phosphoribosyltransferase domain protein [Mycobacterium kansasii]OOK69772.1 phosphoribosyltransferase domain protein [Mycobacterium kansasii]
MARAQGHESGRVGVPIGAPDIAEKFTGYADVVICLYKPAFFHKPAFFCAVGQPGIPQLCSDL